MRETAEEEKKLSVKRGSFLDGVPAITMIVDGGWCKQTQKHSYNAKSSVSIIIMILWILNWLIVVLVTIKLGTYTCDIQYFL